MLGQTGATVMLPCFVTGLQSVLFTKLSNADCGALQPKVVADRSRLRWQSLLRGSFSGGGVLDVPGFKHADHVACLPLALLSCGLAIVPALDDLREIAKGNSQ
jgi:hypothetical protein